MVAVKKSESAQAGAWSLRAEWPHLAAAGALLGVVLGSLLLGLLLRADGPRGVITLVAGDRTGTKVELAATPAPEPRAAVVPPPAPGPREPRPTPTARRPPDALGGRAAADLQRLLGSGSGFTLQFHYGCDAAGVEALLRGLEGAGTSGLYLLPAGDVEAPCFRLCWGAFRSAEEARQARRIPAALQELSHDPLPKSVADLAR